MHNAAVADWMVGNNHDCYSLLIACLLSTTVGTARRLSSGQRPWQDKPQGFVPELERITKQVQIHCCQKLHSSCDMRLQKVALGSTGVTRC